MKYSELITKSQNHFEQTSFGKAEALKTFSSGALWMYQKLKELNSSKNIEFNYSINYSLYGIMKYSLCLAAFIISTFFLFHWNKFLIPISILIFYIVEIHFLFLFPLLIDRVNRPVWTSVRLTYKIGILKALTTIIPIGFYMMIGLLRIKDPLRNWHIGCLAVIIWYEHEIRDRI